MWGLITIFSHFNHGVLINASGAQNSMIKFFCIDNA